MRIVNRGIKHLAQRRQSDDVTVTVTYREILDLRESPATDSTLRDPRLTSPPAECTMDPRLELGFILRVQLDFWHTECTELTSLL